MYAIIETGGKQVKVTEGQEIFVEKVASETGDTVTFDKILMVGGDDVKVGAPYVDGATVTAKVEKQGRQKKINVIKFKPKKNYSRKQGHRRSEEHTSELQSRFDVVCRLLLEKKNVERMSDGIAG